MNYNIYIAELSPDVDVREYAVEIQPPVSSVALDGLVKRLTTRSDRESSYSTLVEDVAVVRQDEEGTALIVTSHVDHLSVQDVGRDIAMVLNPCNLDDHIVNIQPVEGHYGLGD